jgi:hypothetical protein
MFFEGAPRLIDADVTIPGLRAGDPHSRERVPTKVAASYLSKKVKNGQLFNQLPRLSRDGRATVAFGVNCAL